MEHPWRQRQPIAYARIHSQSFPTNQLSRPRSSVDRGLVEDTLVQRYAVGLAVLLVEMDEAPHVHRVVDRIVVIQELDASVGNEQDFGVLEDVQGVDGPWVLSHVIAGLGNPVVFEVLPAPAHCY